MHKLFYPIFTKWPPAAILVFPICSKSIGFFHSRSSMALSNLNLIHALVSQLREKQAFACGGGCGGGGGGGGDGIRTKTIISPKFQIRGHTTLYNVTSQHKLKTSHYVLQCCAMIVRRRVMVVRWSCDGPERMGPRPPPWVPLLRNPIMVAVSFPPV